MVNSDKSIFEYDISPFLQAGVVVGIILIFNLISQLAGLIGIADVDEGTPWLIACALTFFFSIGNSIMSISTDDQNEYWWKSLVSYGIVALLGGGMAYLFSGVNMDEVGSYRWLFVMFAMGHVFFLALVRTMRRIVKMAKEQDKRLRGEE